MEKIRTDSAKSKVDWDEIVSDEFKLHWYNLIKEALTHGHLYFRRATKPPNTVGKPRLVTFWDGSLSAICTVVYVIWNVIGKDNVTKYVSNIVVIKGKVSPLRGITVPRSKCNALALALRITKRVVNYLPDTPDSVLFLGDSQCVISAADNTTSLFTPFMQARLTEIADTIAEIKAKWSVEELMHVSGDLSIAVLGTRSDGRLEDMGVNSTWQTGPKFLKTPRDEWPVDRDFVPVHPPKEEIKMSPKLMTCAIDSTVMEGNPSSTDSLTPNLKTTVL